MKEWTILKLPFPFVSNLHTFEGSSVGFYVKCLLTCNEKMKKKDFGELLRVEGFIDHTEKRSQCPMHVFLVIIIGLILEQEGLNSYHHPLMDYGNIMFILYLSTLLSQFKHNLMIFVVPAALQDATSCLTAIKAHMGLGELRN